MSGLSCALDFLMNCPLKIIDSLTNCYETEHGTFIIEWEGDDAKLELEIGRENYSYYVRFKNTKDPILVDDQLPINITLFESHLGAVGQTEENKKQL